MAITVRKGLSSALIKTKLLPGELAVTTDTGELYFCHSAGNVKKVATSEDVQVIIDASPEAYVALQQLIADLESDPSELTNILSNISTLQSDKLDKTGDSAENTVSFTEAATLENIANGERHDTIMGKIKKFFSFIGTTALTTTANTITGAINELVTAVSGKFSKSDIVQTAAVNDANKVPSSAVTYGLQQQINVQNDNLTIILKSSSDPLASLMSLISSGQHKMFYYEGAPSDMPSMSITPIYFVVDLYRYGAVCFLKIIAIDIAGVIKHKDGYYVSSFFWSNEY